MFDPETSSNYYTNMAENLTGTKPTTKNKITQEINALSFNGKTDILTSKDFRLVSLLQVFKRIIMKYLCSFIEDMSYIQTPNQDFANIALQILC